MTLRTDRFVLPLFLTTLAASAPAQPLVEPGWAPDPEAPYSLPDHAPAGTISNEALKQRFEELVAEHEIKHASWIVVTAADSKDQDDSEPLTIFSAGDPEARSVALGEITPLLVGLAAASVAEQGSLDLDARLHEYRPEFAKELAHLGRAPTTRELLAGMGGARVVGLSALDRPLHGSEVRGLLEQRPNRLHQPSLAGTAIVMWLLGEIEQAPSREVIAESLKQLGFEGVDVPAFGQPRATPAALAKGLSTLIADEPKLEPTSIATMGAVTLGTFDQGLGVTLERIDRDLGWVWSAQNPGSGLSVRIDFERRTVSVFCFPNTDESANIVEDLNARFELLVPSVREQLDRKERYNPRIVARRKMKDLDKNGDGRVSFDELNPLTIPRYRALDQNGNEFVTLDEMTQ